MPDVALRVLARFERRSHAGIGATAGSGVVAGIEHDREHEHEYEREYEERR